MLRLLFALIGYVSTATVISIALGLGYLVTSGRLNDEKMFRAVALVHDVDLAKLAAEQQEQQDAVPSKEPSLETQIGRLHLVDRNMEVKNLALERGRQEFQNLLDRLEEKTARFDRQAKEIQDKLMEQRDLTTNESIAKVVSNLQIMPPENAKYDLLEMVAEQRMADVIRLFKAMDRNTRKKIFATFETMEELNHLHEMHRLMMEGFPEKGELEEAIEDLEKFSGSGS